MPRSMAFSTVCLAAVLVLAPPARGQTFVTGVTGPGGYVIGYGSTLSYGPPLSYPYGAGLGYYFDPYYPGGYFLPPVILPAETLYGPQAVRRFMGLDPPLNVSGGIPYLPPYGYGGLGGGPALAPFGLPAQPAADAKKPRPSNADARARAWQFVGFGDEHFRRQRYSEALSRYKSAARAAADLPEVFARQAVAFFAIGRYELAADALKRAVALSDQPPGWNVQLDRLYADNHVAKTAHLEKLAETAGNNLHNADLLFLVGAMLYFDQQVDRSEVFFQRARQAALGDDTHVRAFEEQILAARKAAAAQAAQ